MRLHRAPPSRRVISLTPLIDVVFLLLVFFMLASTFMKFSALPVVTTGAGAAAPAVEMREVVLIHIGRDNTVTINGETVELTKLQARLALEHQQNRRHAVVAARPGATVDGLARVLSIARRVPFTTLRVVE